MTIKIGQLQTFIASGPKDYCIKFGVENTVNKYAPLLGDTLDFHNTRKVVSDYWFDAVDALNLNELFYNDETGLFKTDSNITPLTKKHLAIVNNAYHLYFESNPKCKPGMHTVIGTDGRLNNVKLTKQDYIGGDIMWLSFWINYAISYFSKPVIANVEYLYV